MFRLFTHIDHRRLAFAKLFGALAGMMACALGQPAGAVRGILPTPTGPFGVGRVTVHWTDSSRTEPLAQKANPRELMVDIWYPAESAPGATAEYLNATAFERA